jgi:hypothetical protein
LARIIEMLVENMLLSIFFGVVGENNMTIIMENAKNIVILRSK